MVHPMLAARLALRLQFDALHVMVLKAVKSHPVCRRLLAVPGVGAVTDQQADSGLCDGVGPAGTLGDHDRDPEPNGPGGRRDQRHQSIGHP